MRSHKQTVTWTILLSLVCALALATPARAAAPVLLGVGQADHHPTATFQAAGADSLTVYLARSPERATDGRFLSENVVETDFLTDGEIATGEWLDADAIASGLYYVMLNASNYSCYAPECADATDGFSNIMSFTIPPRTLSVATARSAIHDVMSDGRLARQWDAVAYSSYDPDPTRRCKRISRLRIRCGLSWFLGDLGFEGKATVVRRLGVEDDEVEWTVKRTDYYCKYTSGKRCSRAYRGKGKS